MVKKPLYETTDRPNVLSDKKYAEDERVFSEFLASAARRKRTRQRDSDISSLNLNDVELLEETDDVQELDDGDWNIEET